jgi:thiol:disulfide interchange protein DsbC
MSPIRKKALFLTLFCSISICGCMKQFDSESKAELPRNKESNGKSVHADSANISYSADAKILGALKKLDPELRPDYIGAAIVPGFREVLINGNLMFITDDGRYIARDFKDISSGRDASELGTFPGFRLKALNDIPVSERIVFAPAGPRKHTIWVFTDVECGFCRKLHQQIGEYNKLGIAIEYLAFPRAGMGTPDAVKMESIWCSDDRRKALTDAKNDIAIQSRQCENPVEKHHDIGQRIGLQGTPMIINADGFALAGYLPPAELLQTLDGLSKQERSNPGESTGK